MSQPSMVDFPGQMAVLMFTPGCNFRCGFCHNADLIPQAGARTYTYGQLREKLRRHRENWVRAVTVSGGEPTIHARLPETIRFLKDEGMMVKLDTNGSNPEMLEELLPLVDYVAMDVKCSPENYPALAGFRGIDRIRRSARLIIDQARDYEFRTTVLESVHTDDDIMAAADLIRGARRWYFQPFLPHDNLPDPGLRQAARTRPSVLEHCARIAQAVVPGAAAR